jgi:hypothetical protein
LQLFLQLLLNLWLVLVGFERFGSFELALVEQDIPLTMHTATDIDAG